jgi:hypothetical protein
LAILLLIADHASAQDQARTPSPPGAEVSFVDIKDGATIGPKTVIHFGLHGMGIAPAGVDIPNSGHHHLLIDTQVPPADEPIPSDENHLHFGAGETEATLDLPPGPHTLQLLLGDKNHLQFKPSVMSPLIHVTVAAPAPTPPPPAAEPPKIKRSPSPPDARVYIATPADGAYVPLKVNVRFGLANMTIAPAGIDIPNSGHHHLLIDTPLPPLDEPIPSDDNHLHFGAGETETTITLTPGKHTLQLLLGDANHTPHDPPVFSKPITIYAGIQPHRPPPAARKLLPPHPAKPPPHHHHHHIPPPRYQEDGYGN